MDFPCTGFFSYWILFRELERIHLTVQTIFSVTLYLALFKADSIITDFKGDMESLLEQQRRYHEERERLLDALVQERMVEKKTNKDSINSEHRQKAMLDRSVSLSTLLYCQALSIYKPLNLSFSLRQR